jgi:hypothetical protein
VFDREVDLCIRTLKESDERRGGMTVVGDIGDLFERYEREPCEGRSDFILVDEAIAVWRSGDTERVNVVSDEIEMATRSESPYDLLIESQSLAERRMDIGEDDEVEAPG